MNAKEWLNNPTDPKVGIELYDAQHGKGRWARSYSQFSPERVVLKRLVYHLSKLVAAGKNPTVPDPVFGMPPYLEALPIVVQAIESKKVAEELIVSATIVYPETRAGKEMEARDLYRQAGKLRADLFSDSKGVREKAALSIQTMMKRNRQLWDEINYFDQHKVWPHQNNDPVDIDIESASMSQLYTLKQNLAPWISKEKKKIGLETNEEKRKERLAALEGKQKRLEMINLKLKSE